MRAESRVYTKTSVHRDNLESLRESGSLWVNETRSGSCHHLGSFWTELCSYPQKGQLQGSIPWIPSHWTRIVSLRQKERQLKLISWNSSSQTPATGQTWKQTLLRTAASASRVKTFLFDCYYYFLFITGFIWLHNEASSN
jgi:hypothetical protein